MLFQSTLPARGATGRRRTTRRHERFQSTLPARGATRLSCASLFFFVDFNPRSPHGERPRRVQRLPFRQNFNPRSPHGERRHQRPHQPPEDRDFNPRSPHGERRESHRHDLPDAFISIHAPRTGSDTDGDAQAPPRKISIHAPRTGSDVLLEQKSAGWSTFQSTLPARGATQGG